MGVLLCEKCKRPTLHSDEDLIVVCTRCEKAGYTVEDSQHDYQVRKQQEAADENTNSN